ncbi:MAG: adenosylcobinamide-GDP ribazoletransferase [Candidatus Methanoplasma sp.]|nr:adenosylcobinamide-GDP ribazoletransferase [Candidatus Methanoplasma sp.]
MPDELLNEQPESFEQEEGSAAGPVSEARAAEPVRPEPKRPRKMSAADFRAPSKPAVWKSADAGQEEPGTQAAPLQASPSEPPKAETYADDQGPAQDPWAADPPRQPSVPADLPAYDLRPEGPLAPPPDVSAGRADGGEGRQGAPSHGNFFGAVKAHVSFFTLFRMDVDMNDIRAAEKRMYLTPVIGLMIGLMAACVSAVVFWVSPWADAGSDLTANVLSLGPAAAITAIGSAVVLAKFLHMDGLADFGDGVAVSGPKEAHIRALKDTRIGAGGLATAMIVTIASFAFLSDVVGVFAVAAAIAGMEIFAKNGMVSAAVFGKPGDGMAAEQVRSTNVASLVISTAIAAGLSLVAFLAMGAVCFLLTGFNAFGSIVPAVVVFIAASAALSITAGILTASISNKRFGFVNGDVLGASNEITRLVVLAGAFTISHLML